MHLSSWRVAFTASVLTSLAIGGCDCGDDAQLTVLTPQMDVQLESLDFGEVPLGATKWMTFSIFNSGTADLEITDLTAAVPFSASADRTTVKPGGTAFVEVAFIPPDLGEQNGTIVISSDARDKPTAEVSCRGIGVDGMLMVNPTQIDLSGTLVGSTVKQLIEISNFGLDEESGAVVPELFQRPEHYSYTSIAGGFESVPYALGSLEHLVLELAYRPLSAGQDDGRIVVEVCGSRCGIAITVVASSGESVIRLDPPVVDFGAVGLGESRSEQIVAENLGQEPVEITAVTVSGGPDLSATPNKTLPTSLAGGERIGITLAFAPQVIGSFSGEVEVATNDSVAPVVRAAVIGSGEGPIFSVLPEAIHFGVERGPGTYQRSLLLINAGSGEVSVSSVRISGDSELSLGGGIGLPLRLGAGESATETVLFETQVVGAYNATITIESDDPSNATVTVPVEAGMAEQVCELQVNPAQVSFGLGSIWAPKTASAELTNIGTDDCELVSGDFRAPVDPVIRRLNPSWPITLTPGDRTTFDFEYAPTQETESKGNYVVQTSDPVFPERHISLIGRATSAGDCLDVSPTLLHFGTVLVSSTRNLGTQVTNTSAGQDCSILSTSLTPGSHPAFSTTVLGRTTLRPNRSQLVSVSFEPQTATIATGVLKIFTDDPVAPEFVVQLVGGSAHPNICVTPRQLAFADVPATLDFTIEACGSDAVTIMALDWTTSDNEISLQNPPSLPFTLQPGMTEVIHVVYSPRDQTSDSAVVAVESDDLAEPIIAVGVTGGPSIVPPAAGRFLYYWNIDGPGDVNRISLQGQPSPAPFWGGSTGRACTGCHSLSPDGKYVSLIEGPSVMLMVDIQTKQIVPQQRNIGFELFVSWNPNVNTAPPYQYVYTDNQDLHISSLFDGYIGKLQGADDPMFRESMPSWGPNGQIVFVRSTGASGVAIRGTSELMLIPESGGVAVPVAMTPPLGQLVFYPSFSRNGNWIAFNHSFGTNSYSAFDAVIKLVKADQSGTVLDLPQANDPTGPSTYPTWSVNGQFLSFSSKRQGGVGGWDLYIAPIDPITGADGPAQNVQDANTPGFQHAAHWSP